MPELPEVETVKRRLSLSLIDKEIIDIDVFYPSYSSLKQINNEKILDIKRKGKYLIFVLSNHFIVSHLRMEGKYHIKEEKDLSKHDLVRFNFKNFYLFYNDVRKFGTFNCFNKDIDIYNEYPLKDVGPEPFDVDGRYLYQKLTIKNEPIKAALLDQHIISGLGNIYVDETLFMSSINPHRKSNTITEFEASKLIESARIVLNKAIKLGGSTIKSFESFNGEIGHFQTELSVHLREGERCKICNAFIIKDRCAGRGTYYCPNCQREDENKKLFVITGGYASGKSSVLKILNNLGYETISLDDIYNNLFQSSTKMKNAIKKKLKISSKEELKKLVFSDKEKNNILMSITHPFVMEELYKEISKMNVQVIFIEVPLLFEGGFEKTFDKIIDVYSSPAIRDNILKNKGISYEDFIQRSNSQINIEEKRKKADFMVYNDGTKKDLLFKVKELLKMMEV